MDFHWRRSGRHRRDLRAGLAVLLVVAGLAACAESGAAGDADAFATRDSAGVRITESAAPLWEEGEGWRLDEVPVLELGMADGPPEYLLSGVRSLIRTADGGVVLVNGGSHEVRYYDGEGRYLRSIGRQGGGPGEFRQLFWIALIRGDTLLAYDFPARTVSAFGPDGELVRSTKLDGIDGFPHVLPAMSDGSMVVMLREMQETSAAGDGQRFVSETLLHVSPSGELLDTIVRMPPLEQYQVSATTEGGIATTSMPVLFGASTITAVAGDRLIAGRNDRYELPIYDPSTGLERIVRRRIEPRPVTEAVIAEAFRESQASMRAMGSQAGRELMSRALDERPHAETLPFFMRVLADDGGRLWVQNFAAPGEDRAPWTIFDGDGRMLGSMMLPERFTPSHIGADFVLGVARDELDVERVRIYRLLKD